MSVTVRDRVRPDGETLAWIGLVLTSEFLLVAGYVLLLDVAVRDWTLFVIPFVWINVGGWAILRTRPAPSPARKRRVAAAIAGGYFLLLAYFGGLVALDSTGVSALSINVLGIPPGWSPAIIYAGNPIHVVLLPYKVVGYVALAYLVYATVLDAASALVGGVVGIFSCVSCSFPIVAGVATGVAGGGGALAAATAEWTYLISTAVFVVTVGLLYWRPSLFGGR